MSNGAGIQELMAAETRASQIVAEARIGKWQISRYTTMTLNMGEVKDCVVL